MSSQKDLFYLKKNHGIKFLYICICSFRFVGRFMNRRERLEILGDKMKRFNNVYIKNFGDEMSEDEMKDMFEPFGKLISVKVNLTASVV